MSCFSFITLVFWYSSGSKLENDLPINCIDESYYYAHTLISIFNHLLAGGISYRALLPQKSKAKPNRAFNRLLAGSRAPEESKVSPRSGHLDSSMSDDNSYDSVDDDDDSSSGESGTYVCGFLDDPEWVSGRHRHVMVGDKVVGPILSSSIQFVKPSELKRELNKKFRERFDDWKPPKSQRK